MNELECRLKLQNYINQESKMVAQNSKEVFLVISEKNEKKTNIKRKSLYSSDNNLLFIYEAQKGGMNSLCSYSSPSLIIHLKMLSKSIL